MDRAHAFRCEPWVRGGRHSCRLASSSTPPSVGQPRSPIVQRKALRDLAPLCRRPCCVLGVIVTQNCHECWWIPTKIPGGGFSSLDASRLMRVWPLIGSVTMACIRITASRACTATTFHLCKALSAARASRIEQVYYMFPFAGRLGAHHGARLRSVIGMCQLDLIALASRSASFARTYTLDISHKP
jgi:hypothetical protein